MIPFILGVCLIAASGFQGSGAESISSQKCKEYGKLFQASDFKLPDGETPTSCNKRIFAGTKEAKLGEFPYMATIMYNSSSGVTPRCTGALISTNYVIAPAYCLNTRSFGPPTTVILGQLQVDEGVSELTPGAQQIKIIELTLHPEFSAKTRKNVLGLIKLEKSVVLDRSVHPICLNEEDISEQEIMFSGWNFQPTVNREEQVGDLIKSMMTLFTQDECKNVYNNPDKPALAITDKELCAGTKSANCNRQPVGTLQIVNKDVPCMDSLVAVVSHGKGPCAGNKIPKVFTNIKSYVPWIESIVWK